MPSLREAGVSISRGYQGDRRGKFGKLFISTTGIGWAPDNRAVSGDQAQPGDAVLISGPLGNHGIAVLQARGNLGFQSDVRSDTAPLNHLTQGLCAAFPDVHVLRDPTRGGLATTLVEIAAQSGVTIQLDEKEIPIDTPVRSACDLLGLDPLYLANEGKVIVILPEETAEAALQYMRGQKYGEGARRIARSFPFQGQLLCARRLDNPRMGYARRRNAAEEFAEISLSVFLIYSEHLPRIFIRAARKTSPNIRLALKAAVCQGVSSFLDKQTAICILDSLTSYQRRMK